MPRFNSLQELDEWRQKQGLSLAVRAATPESDALPGPESLPSENTAPKPSDHTPSSAMSIDSMSPMPGGSFIMCFRRLIPLLKCLAAAIAVLIVWSLVAHFTAEIAPWTGSNIVSLGVAILAIAIAGYLLVIYSQVYEGIPQDILTLRADVMRRLDTLGASSQGKATVQSQEYTTIIQEEFELWMQSEQFTLLP